MYAFMNIEGALQEFCKFVELDPEGYPMPVEDPMRLYYTTSRVLGVGTALVAPDEPYEVILDQETLPLLLPNRSFQDDRDLFDVLLPIARAKLS